MLRLKDRQTQIPYGLRYHCPATGFRARPFTSFHRIVDQVMELRKANPHLTKVSQWATDFDGVAQEVDYYNALICQTMGWGDYIVGGGEGAAAPIPFPDDRRSPPRKSSAGLVAAVKNTGAGVGLVADWLGEQLVPVDPKVAQARADICVHCPVNGDPNFIESLTGMAASGIRSLIQLKKNMVLKTTVDDQLHTCKACGCTLVLKVWAQMDHIKKHLTSEQQEKLDRGCWILTE